MSKLQPEGEPKVLTPDADAPIELHVPPVIPNGPDKMISMPLSELNEFWLHPETRIPGFEEVVSPKWTRDRKCMGGILHREDGNDVWLSVDINQPLILARAVAKIRHREPMVYAIPQQFRLIPLDQ